ncbi:Putative NAD(P)H-dependent FMN-containing oxidoreductase YwqN [Methanimicrococcus stummii]|uniref:NAD(P)H-dependent FMN-containing oxidoreductase YwqN n=1 Tax=Methanimicrococcus stummii TaxID=3028294 RepID=A0AA96VAS5_9EURY|nr:NAD(P)H-dependent oxidoreductase [Methanimicrococcus sp. Es2]WNY28870.1 Putative NAD(P)H-dependent FMN-containing oxidoreductase YwqN [Methanimicrococcus sp. Es2]
MAKITGFSGSPRKNGNTNFLMETILKSAADKGWETDFVLLNKADIGFCEACDACHKSGNGCVKKDDMTELGEKLKESDVWVLGTPVYWWGPTAQMKVFMDRWYGLPRETYQNKKVILVVPMEDTEDKTASHVIGMYQDAFDYIGVEIADIIVAKGVLEAGAVQSKPEIIKRAEATVDKI